MLMLIAPLPTMTNVLTNDAHDPVTETPEFKVCAVRIEPLERGEPAG